MMLVITGFHRSGTSALAQIMHGAGLFMGDALLGANRHNPFGHVEDLEVVAFHDRILADNGATWRLTDDLLPAIADDLWHLLERFVGRRQFVHRQWGFKDPRACLFLPVWKHLVPEARVVAVVRRPEDCVASLERRHYQVLVEAQNPGSEHRVFWTELDLGIRMWLTYNRALLRFVDARPEDAMVVRFEHLVDAGAVVADVVGRWGFDLDPGAVAGTWHQQAVNQRGSRLVVHDTRLIDEVEATYDRLTALADERLRHAITPVASQADDPAGWKETMDDPVHS